MNYESYVNGNFESNLNKAEALLNECQQLMQKDNIDKALNASFQTLKDTLEANINSETKTSLDKVKQDLENANTEQLKTIFNDNKESISENIKNKIDLKALILANKDEIFNDEKTQEEFTKFLSENQQFKNTLESFKEECLKQKDALEKEASEKLNALNLNDLANAYLNTHLKDIALNAFNENSESISQTSVDALKKDEDFLNSLSEDIVKKSGVMTYFRSEAWDVLEDYNERVIRRLMDEKAIKKRLLEQDILLFDLAIGNEIKTINDNLALINDLTLAMKRKEYLDQVNAENANKIMENKFKAV